MRGKLIVIEGGDGAGKATQAKELAARLRAEGREVETVSFPRYGQVSAKPVEAYLKGEFGRKEDVGAYVASVFFAHDRRAAGATIEGWLENGKIVIADRYVQSNMAHQGALIADPAARADFFRWLDDYEYVRLGIPRPDLTVVLASSPETRDANVLNRSRDTGRATDILEDDLPYQERVERIYREIAATFPSYVLVNCLDEAGKLIPVKVCHDKVWEHVKRLV